MTLELEKSDLALPPVYVAEGQYKRLLDLASGAMNAQPGVAGELLQEIERADVLPPAKLPDDVVTIGARVEFQVHGAPGLQTVYLVFPEDADISALRISVLTPLGAALIGLRVGHDMYWETRTGTEKRFTVTGVDQNPDDTSYQ